MNVAHLLKRQCSLRPEATALIEGGGRWWRRSRRISFAALDSAVASFAGILAHDGIGCGDRVLILMPMSIDLYVALIGVMRVGAVATFLDPSAGREHIEHCCRIAEPKGLIVSAKARLLRRGSPALRRINQVYGRSALTLAPDAAPAEIAQRRSDDPALLTFTSGSTGRPKAAVRTHGFLAAQHAALEEAIELKAGDLDLATLPIFALANLASGLTNLIPDADLRRPGFIDPGPVLRQIRRNRPTRSVASPAFFERLLNGKGGAKAFGSFARVFTGGAPVFPGLLDRLSAAMPDGRVLVVYGSTEAEPISHIAWDEVSAEDRAAMFSGGGLLTGRPVRQIQLRIIPVRWGAPLSPMSKRDLETLSQPPGQPGEIVVHGGHVLGGYLDGVGDEQSKFRVDGAAWHRTGDVGRLDESGRLWLLGRAEACISDARGTVYPFAVECAASRVEWVRRSALVSHEGKRILLVEPPPPRESLGQLKDELAWAELDEVWYCRIPVDKRHNAKVDYTALRQLVTDRHA